MKGVWKEIERRTKTRITDNVNKEPEMTMPKPSDEHSIGTNGEASEYMRFQMM